MAKSTISSDHIARVEGHASIHVSIKNGAVDKVEMNVIEAARLFEAMVKGRSYKESSYICSRICGICSETHVITDIQAIESIFDVRVSERTKLLRQLLIYGSYIQNHASHLFVFAVPDFLGQKSVFPLADSNPELLEKALGLKSLGNELCNMIGGRSIHPITAVVGGFTHEISSQEYLDLADEIDSHIPFALETVDLFNSFPVPNVRTKGDLMALVEEGAYPVQSSDTLKFVRCNTTFNASEKDDYIEEYKVNHSAALFSRMKQTGGTYFTGALARINCSWDNLSSPAKLAAAKAGLRPPVLNPFKNNVAQAVEIVDALVQCSAICRELAKGEGTSEPVSYEVKAGHGVGVTEAPRGICFHEYELDENGMILRANIATPTCQNMANLEIDTHMLVESLLAQHSPESVIQLEIEKLVRAYDPCYSCSVH